MSNFAYINGRYCHAKNAHIHIEDRGFQFADAAYEVIPVVDYRLIDEQPHLDRMQRSLKEINIDNAPSNYLLKTIMRQLLHKNNIKNGSLYMQISRGQYPRDFAIRHDVKPTIAMTTKHINGDIFEKTKQGIAIFSMPDIRWGRCDIKTVSLLASVLAKDASKQRGGSEAVYYNDNKEITEGGSSNIFMINQDGVLITRPAGNDILNGITRQTIMYLAQIHQIRVEERVFSREELYHAKEVFVSAATAFVTPVLHIDEKPINHGKIGDFSAKIQQYMENYIFESEQY